jgi:hypothetical protein
MFSNNTLQSLRKEFATESLFLRNTNNKVIIGALCDIVHRYNSHILCLKNVTLFHGKHVNVISFTTIRRVKTFQLHIFTKHINDQHCTLILVHTEVRSRKCGSFGQKKLTHPSKI